MEQSHKMPIGEEEGLESKMHSAVGEQLEMADLFVEESKKVETGLEAATCAKEIFAANQAAISVLQRILKQEEQAYSGLEQLRNGDCCAPETQLKAQKKTVSIGGVVTDILGRPLQRAKVFAGGQCAFCDCNGKYQLKNLRVGCKFEVYACFQNKKSVQKTVCAEQDCNIKIDFKINVCER